jgi:hypothetical protein
VVSRRRIWLAGVIGRRVLAEAPKPMGPPALAFVTIGRQGLAETPMPVVDQA